MKRYIRHIQENTFVKKNKNLLIAGVIVVVAILAYAAGGGKSSDSYSSTNESLFTKQASYRVESEALAVDSFSADYAEESLWIPEPPFAGGEAEYDESAERRVIKNGTLYLVVRDIEKSRTDIEQKAQSIGGYVSDASFTEGSFQRYDDHGRYQQGRDFTVRSGSLTIRVPTPAFEQAISLFKANALSVESENIWTDDVTEQYSDLEARIANKQAEEAQYRALLTRATDIEDILSVTQYLNQTRGEIERMQGQLNRLSNQTELSTITVSLTSEEDIELFGVVWSPWQEIKIGFQNLLAEFVGFINAVISFVFFIPILLLYAAAVALIIWILYKLFKKVHKIVKKS